MLEEIRIRHIHLDDKALPCSIDMKPLNCREGRRVQQTLCWLAWLP